MDINEVKDLIHEVLQSDIVEFELEHSDTKIRLKRELTRESVPAPIPSPKARTSFTTSSPAAAETAVRAAVSSEDEESGLHIITSPIVGTAYRAPSPEAEPYVKTGDHVSEGTILCLVEAMKLMNEIPSDIAGEVVRIYFENGSPVEFGQKLFAIRPQQ
ncbi:MAG: acetyl-CoA carboxylase biotin carboxyl carrier protein [Acidobacteria bacterium]|nr:acetyl-CoA carboxylase biotin carboxyl carrier protein [Acidobacteriota bacterium]